MVERLYKYSIADKFIASLRGSRFGVLWAWVPEETKGT